MNEQQELAIQALTQMQGDDGRRVRAAFRGMSADELKKGHGYSGKSRQEILDEAEKRDAKFEAAIAWVKSR